MRTLPTPALLALFLTAPVVHAHDHVEDGRADDPWYLQFSVGAVSAAETDIPGGGSVDFDTGFSTSLAVGRHVGELWGMSLGLEFEGIHTSFNIDEGELPQFTTNEKGASGTALLGNIVLDCDLSDAVSAYVGGGFGYATKIEFETLDSGGLTQNDDSGTAGQIKAGFRYHLGGLTDVALGYRFLFTEDVEVSGGGQTEDASFENHIIELAFRWGL